MSVAVLFSVEEDHLYGSYSFNVQFTYLTYDLSEYLLRIQLKPKHGS